MSTAKQLIIDNLSDISDGIQDEFEVMERSTQNVSKET